MSRGDTTEWFAEAVEDFDRHEKRTDGARVVSSLVGGLIVLRESLYLRVHQDVERVLGKDSMLIPLSETKSQHRTRDAIETYQVAESAVAVGDFGYVSTKDDWYLSWLARLRLGERKADAETIQQLRRYVSKTPHDRRLAFMDVLARVLPESRRAPLILFRLVPWSVQIVTAVAFGDHATASDLRTRQVTDLPGIGDCRQCQGKVLDNGETCPACGNPLWRYEWLTAVD